MDLQKKLDMALAMAECLNTEELLASTAELLDEPLNKQALGEADRTRLTTLLRELQASITELRALQTALDQLGPRLTPSLGVPLAVIHSRLNVFAEK